MMGPFRGPSWSPAVKLSKYGFADMTQAASVVADHEALIIGLFNAGAGRMVQHS
jgi:hypothetical protein